MREHLDFFEASFIFAWYYIWAGVLCLAVAGLFKLVSWLEAK